MISINVFFSKYGLLSLSGLIFSTLLMPAWGEGLGDQSLADSATLSVDDTEAAKPPLPEAADGETQKSLWGVELMPLRRVAAGHMLDFRYRVLDSTKAAPLFVRQTKPRLLHKASGKVLAVPETAKLGPLRNSDTPQAGRIYWMFFGNPGGLVQSGDQVSVVIGDFRADLSVE